MKNTELEQLINELQKMIVRKGELSFYDIFTLARAESTS